MSTDIQALAERVQRLEDEVAIKELKYRYLNACDEKEVDAINDCFAEGKIVINYANIGEFDNRDDFVALYTRMACVDNIFDMHHAQNPIITVTGPDTAIGKVALRFFNINTEAKTCAQMAGHYNDEYKKIDGQWRIVKTVFTPRTTEIKGYAEEVTKTLHAGPAAPAVG